jgi:hypothetical protein
MLKCRDIAHRASDHIEGTMHWREKIGYLMHVLMCGYCRQFIRGMYTAIVCGRTVAASEQLPDADAANIVKHVFEQTH